MLNLENEIISKVNAKSYLDTCNNDLIVLNLQRQRRSQL